MLDPQLTLAQRFAAAVAAAFGPEFADADPIIRPAANPRFGDFQANLAMPLAKRLGKPPRDVANAVVAALDWQDLCEEVPGIAGPGFINLKLRSDYLDRLAAGLAADDRLAVEKTADPQTVVLDYSGPNVAKEMHVGHLRSSVIGDALARTLDFLGHRVIRQNHLGDWGTQFGMLIQYLVEKYDRYLEAAQSGKLNAQIGDLNIFYRNAKARFDEDSDFADRSRQRVVSLQAGDEETLAIWRFLVIESARHFNAVYRRLGVTLTDADVRPESFYNDQLAAVVAELKEKKIALESEGATCVFVEGFDAPLVIQKSGGGYGYATTDLAAIRFRTATLGARRIAYVVDARQRDHFAMVFDTAKRAGWLDHATAEHVQFGTILGEDGKPFKTRSGETVKLVDLLDEAQQRAAKIVTEKNPDLAEGDREHVARVVGIGAVKYADLSSDRVKDYVFSWDRMLAMEGNTAPYLQYAYARIRSIFRKGVAPESPGTAVPGFFHIDHPAERTLVLTLVQFGGVIRSVAGRLEPHHLCNYLYTLAAAFSGFYENCPVLKADTDAQRRSRLALCDLTARTLKQGLGLLGIEVLDRM